MTHEGRDVTESIKKKLRDASQAIHVAKSEKGKIEITNQIASQLADAVGYVPMCIWHTQEYLPYFQGHDVNKNDALTIRQWSVEVRRTWMNECWTDMRNIASGKRTVEDFLAKTSGDHASDIIEAMWGGLPKRFYINVPNHGAVPNMTDDAFLELLCDVNMNDVRPLPFGPMPRPLTGYLQRVLDEHELAVEAAVTHDRKILRQAFLASMVAVSISDVDACIAELLAAEKKYLPAAWYR